MITQAIAEARRDQVLRELLERVELREMCLQALTAHSGRDFGWLPSVLRLIRDKGLGAVQ